MGKQHGAGVAGSLPCLLIYNRDCAETYRCLLMHAYIILVHVIDKLHIRKGFESAMPAGLGTGAYKVMQSNTNCKPFNISGAIQ